MAGYFTHYPAKHRDAFEPPSPPLSTSGATPSTPARNPNPFDPNLYVPSQNGTPTTFQDASYRKDQDFQEELAALMKSGTPHPTGSANHPGYDEYARHPPHNIFDVSAHPTNNHHGHYPPHFSIPIPNPQYRPGSSHHGPDSPFSSHSPFSAHSEGGFAHHMPLPSPLPPLNINGHHPPGPDDPIHPSSPFVHHPPPLSAIDHHRPSSPFNDSRSRSRSKPPMSAGGINNPSTRTRMSKKRASISGIERPHPSAIMIPSNGSRPTTASDSAPLSAHTMGWPAFSLPTPDSLSTHGFGSFPEKNVPSHSKKEESPDVDPVTKQAAIAHEKRRRRRESHNAVERRRRDNINEKISELATLIPECLLDPVSTSTGSSKEMGIEVFTAVSGSNGDDGDSKEPPAIKANKGMILRKSVDYIRYLQQLVTAQASRNRELEAQVQQLQGGAMGASPSISSPHSSDSAPELNNHNFHVFGEEIMNGLNGMGMVDILHSLAPEESDSYLNMQYAGAPQPGSKSPPRFDGLETLHEHTQDVPQQGSRGNDGDMELDETSPSASGDSHEDHAEVVEKEEASRGRARLRSRKVDETAAEEVQVKKESPMEV